MKRILVLLATLASASPAFADSMADQVERLDVERGERELEVQSVYASAVEDEPSVMTLDIQGEWGVSDRLALGFELESVREGAEGFEAEAFALQAKYVVLDPEDAAIGFGAQLSLERDFQEEATEAELRLLAETRAGGLVFAGDVQIEGVLDGEEDEDVAVRYSARADWARSWGALSLEAGGDLKTDEETRAWLGPVATFDGFGPVAIELAWFAPLSDATPDTQARIALRLPL
jgi:hypothetical protein